MAREVFLLDLRPVEEPGGLVAEDTGRITLVDISDRLWVQREMHTEVFGERLQVIGVVRPVELDSLAAEEDLLPL